MTITYKGITAVVGGVIVAYNPDIKEFRLVIKAALTQLDFLVVVNNSQNSFVISKDIDFIESNEKRFSIIENGENVGIAKALNIGLEFLKNCGCSHFLLLDHDSLIPKSMVRCLVEMYILLSESQNVAAVGPAYFNSRLKKFAPFIRYGNLTLQKIDTKTQKKYVETHFLISSGSLLSLESLSKVGYMEEGLFIDYVDTEWCLRAISLGYKLYGTNEAVMEHSLGDEPIKILGLRLPLHSPLRHYYLVRNAIALGKKKYIPLKWKIIILTRMLRSFIFYSIAPYNRLDHVKKMMIGMVDGVKGRQGKYKPYD